MKGASGSAWVAVGPPATTRGSASVRSRDHRGMPPRSSMSSTFVYVSSYCSENPTTSKCDKGWADSSDRSGSSLARSWASMSVHGA
jgi:hypothetical protein